MCQDNRLGSLGTKQGEISRVPPGTCSTSGRVQCSMFDSRLGKYCSRKQVTTRPSGSGTSARLRAGGDTTKDHASAVRTAAPALPVESAALLPAERCVSFPSQLRRVSRRLPGRLPERLPWRRVAERGAGWVQVPPTHPSLRRYCRVSSSFSVGAYVLGRPIPASSSACARSSPKRKNNSRRHCASCDRFDKRINPIALRRTPHGISAVREGVQLVARNHEGGGRKKRRG